ncbi:MAG: hypothetical protein ACNA78_05060 [Balneolaceae bacterium]
MEQLVRDITTQFIAKLPQNTPFITPTELNETDIPRFITRRMREEMIRNLSVSVVPPESEWADMNAHDVEEAWEHFLEAIVAQIRMPAAHLPAVMEIAVGDCMDLIVQPRTAIPDIIFGGNVSLSYDDLERQCRLITVNSHFADAMLRYMDRKGKNELTREECSHIIQRVDNRLIGSYNPLNWAQLMEPLFRLTGPKADSDLFRIFFEDKGLKPAAKRFDEINASLSKSEFIEVLSAPDLLREEIVDDVDATRNFKKPGNTSTPSAKSKATPAEPDQGEQQPIDFDFTYRIPKIDDSGQVIGSEGESKDTGERFAAEEDEDSILANFRKKHRPAADESDAEDTTSRTDDKDKSESAEAPSTSSEEESPLYARFSVEDESDDTRTDREEAAGMDSEPDAPAEEPDSEKPALFTLDEDLYVEHDMEDDAETLAARFFIDSEESSEEQTEADDEEVSPIWQSFFLGDQPEERNIDEEDEEAEELANRVKKEQIKKEKEELTQLANWLSDDRARFNHRLFRNGPVSYEQALRELSKCEDWKEASRFIEKGIFSKNKVDMYDDAAVDFIDRMHAYFIECKSLNKSS